MPLLQKNWLNSHTLLGIWKTDEAIDALNLLLPSHVSKDNNLITHPKREREWLASRVLVYKLLEEFTASPLPLLRNEHGKPYFKDSELQISITHAPQFAAVIISEKNNVGIDIELISPKALRIADKFLNEGEKGFTCNDELKTCLYWSAKETLYKLYSRKQLIFKDNLVLSPSFEENILLGSIKTELLNKSYQIQYNIIQDHVLTYCIS